MPAAAKFFAKVYNFTGVTFRRVLPASVFLNAPSIVREVGMPAGDLSIDLAYPWDDFGYGVSTGINLADLVKVYAINEANPTGLLVYQGHIEEITGTYASGGNRVSLRLFPIDALIGRSLWKAAGSYVVTYASADVDTILSDVIDDINSIYGATFFTKNLGNPALTINQTFTRITHQAAVDSAALALLATWYWRIRANGQVDLQQYNDSTADHRLTLVGNVDSLVVTKSVMEVKNKIVVSWGPTPTDAEYTDATSQTAYGRRMEIVSDRGINDSGSSDTKGAGELARLKDPFTKTQLTVNATYAIETIKAGDTVRIVNISNGSSQMVSGVLRVKRVVYDGATAVLDLADTINNFGTELSRLLA